MNTPHLSFGAQRLRRLSVSLAAGLLLATSLFAVEPAAADTAYPVNVTFDTVNFTMVNDGSCFFEVSCLQLEIYGVVGAYTTAGASSASGGMPYRIFGKWGQDPCDSDWYASYGASCAKEVYAQTYNFTDVLMCAGSTYQTCSTGYSRPNNTISLQVHPGEQFKVTVLMEDYDSYSANDRVCNTNTWFGPYSAAELQAKKYVTDAKNRVLMMPFNGDGECWIGYHLS
jgi:hypothetical protein